MVSVKYIFYPKFCRNLSKKERKWAGQPTDFQKEKFVEPDKNTDNVKKIIEKILHFFFGCVSIIHGRNGSFAPIS